jgi:tetratricopeptide (TPR) repeat protein/TolB-like protein
VDLEKIIAKALAPRKEDRYQHMEDLAVDLKRLGREMEAGSALSYEDLQKGLAPGRRRSRLLGALAVTLALALVAFGGWRIASRAGAKPDPRKLLILPIDVRGQGEGADYVGRAFAESLAVNLAEAGGVHLLPVPAEGELRASGPGASVREAEARGAGRLLTGVLTREGESVHASLSLVDVTENRIVWGVEEVARPEDLRALAPALARKVGAKLGASAPKPYDSPFNLTTREPLLDSPLYSEAVAAVRDQDPSAAAVTGRLVGEFPGEPDAHVLRAFAEWYAAAGYPPGSPRRTALDAALDALDRVDPGSPWDDYLRSVAAQWDGRHPEAVDRTTRILERGDLTPSARAFVLKRRGEQRTIYGDVAAGLDDLEEARRLEPADAEVYTFLSQVLTNEARPEDGLVRARQAAALSPLPKSRRALAWALQNLGRWDEAADAWMETCGSTEVPYMCALAAHALQHAGREPEAREAARRAEAAEPNPWGALWLAHTFAAGGDRAKAIRAFERYLDLNPSPAPDDLSGPDWAAFQGDRRLQDLLEDEWKAAADAWAQDCTAAPTMFTCGMHALALQKVGRQADASEAADRASEMVESAWGHYYLARCRALAGDRTAAVGHLRRYLELRAGGDPRLAGNPDFRRLDGDEEFESILVEIRGPRWVGH